MLIFQSFRPLKLISGLGLALSIAMLGACSSSDPTKVEADFQINSVKGSVSGQNVTIDLTAKEACTDLTNLVADVEAYGASVSPDPKVARDYSQPVKFTVTAPDGTQVVYTVTVKGNSCGYTPPPSTSKTCTPAPIGTTGYSLVFKACDANNIATYYDKTECVRDNSTGLIWQGQTAAGTGTLRDNDKRYTNFDSITSLQKWDGMTWVAPSQDDLDASTNSIGFKNAINTSTLCGGSDWRVPALNELSCLVVGDSPPYIDLVWFPNTLVDKQPYWTSTSAEENAPRAYMPFVMLNDPYAYYIYLGYGSSDKADRSSMFSLRLVRGNASKTCILSTS
ncbi:MAG TPA: DUF1566 domain-containing protein [Burkholderiaceae bacterium]|nr:DUF1566 domain-containing protein [Burkholderiaceae bacterium]